jgi:hypothetical protein
LPSALGSVDALRRRTKHYTRPTLHVIEV